MHPVIRAVLFAVTAASPCSAQPCPEIVAQPVSRATCPATPLVFTVEATGGLGRSYQWQNHRYDGWFDIPEGGDVLGDDDIGSLEFWSHSQGSTTPHLTISGMAAHGPGYVSYMPFRCIVSADCGVATSQTAALSICRADFNCDGRLTPADVADFVAVWFASLQNGTLQGDYDYDGLIQPVDISYYVSDWFYAFGYFICR